jgi:hypothetical protein
MSEATISVVANKPFHWSQGAQLRARRATVIAVPAGILIEGEMLGSIIEISSDDTRIAFQEATESVGGFAAILIELQSGAFLKLNRSTEAIALGSTSEEFVFDVT